ncbi:MAG: biopolymer transporter ExbD [Chlamydiota bacterium]|nr:biopolymer transporter ExbD [Chlamydiota bacterium]
MRFKTKLKASHSLIDLTPLVDVIFLLLIFFIITSDILPLKSLNIESPTLSRDSAPLTTQLVVIVDAQNVIYVGSKKAIVGLHSLKSQLMEEIGNLKKQNGQQDPTVVVSIDRRVEYGDFLKVFSIAQECCQNLRLVYKPTDETNSEYF